MELKLALLCWCLYISCCVEFGEKRGVDVSVGDRGNIEIGSGIMINVGKGGGEIGFSSIDILGNIHIVIIRSNCWGSKIE